MQPYQFPTEEVEKIIGYTFKDKSLLRTAFIHSSYSKARGGKDNDRMETLGDAILELVITEKLYLSNDNFSAQDITEHRKIRVQDESLKIIVEKLGLDKYLIYEGKRMENLGKKAIPSLFEALTAAIYLDGEDGMGYAAAKKFVLEKTDFLKDFFDKNRNDIERNYVGELKELIEKKGGTFIKPDAEQTKDGFVCTMKVFSFSATSDAKPTKKQAESDAARKILILQSEKKNI